MKKGIVYPRLWLPHWRTRRALIGYPLYDVPNKVCEADLAEGDAQVQENFAYFMRVRHERLAFFLAWLRDRFKINGSLTPDGVLEVNRWVDRFGGGVVETRLGTAGTFARYNPPWTGENIGYNVMIDLGIFIGEYVIWRRPQLFWEIYRGHEIEPETFGSIGYLRPTLAGLPFGWKSDVLTSGYGLIMTSVDASKIGHSRASCGPNRLLESIRQDLYLSRLDETVEFIGDSKDEPL